MPFHNISGTDEINDNSAHSIDKRKKPRTHTRIRTRIVGDIHVIGNTHVQQHSIDEHYVSTHIREHSH